MKGIILAGGTGTRLHPITIETSKQLLPVYDKPMIYYPLSTLMLAGIKEIMIISTPKDIPRYKELFGNGNKIGINLEYEIQEKAKGIAEAFIIGEKFIGADSVALILGDNLFYGEGLSRMLLNSRNRVEKERIASIFAYSVGDPENYGVVSFDKKDLAIDIQEKPKMPKSNFAVVGLYFYPNNVVSISKEVMPSNRRELEITSINTRYLESKNLHVQKMGRGFAWFDTGTAESLLEASQFIRTLERRQGLKIGCIEEIAFDKNLISKIQLEQLVSSMKNNPYSEYLKKKIKD
jgi:glucose-1-phosphate thymidylyltransferase